MLPGMTGFIPADLVGTTTTFNVGTTVTTVPDYLKITFRVWGGGGSGGSYRNYYAPVAARGSSVVTGSVSLSAGAGGTGTVASRNATVAGGAGGTATGGDINIPGAAGGSGDGAARPSTGGVGGSAPNGGAGGAGGVTSPSGNSYATGSGGSAPGAGGGGGAYFDGKSYGYGGGGGGAGGYVEKTFIKGNPGAPVPGASMTIVVGERGTSDTTYNGYGGDGARGRVQMTVVV